MSEWFSFHSLMSTHKEWSEYALRSAFDDAFERVFGVTDLTLDDAGITMVPVLDGASMVDWGIEDEHTARFSSDVLTIWTDMVGRFADFSDGAIVEVVHVFDSSRCHSMLGPAGNVLKKKIAQLKDASSAMIALRLSYEDQLKALDKPTAFMELEVTEIA